jgi:hypothetical protein
MFDVPAASSVTKALWEGAMTTTQSEAILCELRALNDRLDLHALEMSNLRSFLDTQFKRIAQLQAELDLLPTAQERRKSLRMPAPTRRPSRNGNGDSPR